MNDVRISMWRRWSAASFNLRSGLAILVDVLITGYLKDSDVGEII
jgi:hypothetical protein